MKLRSDLEFIAKIHKRGRFSVDPMAGSGTTIDVENELLEEAKQKTESSFVKTTEGQRN